ncbi:MAG TPA: hypothetical protein VFU34_03975, partial [Gaiellaceae bacterium]|nr:hypothetical protein [Gaiellaceae bacterium]
IPGHDDVMRRVLGVLALTFTLTAPSAAATCDDLEAAKRATYGFRPSQLSQQASRSSPRSISVIRRSTPGSLNTAACCSTVTAAA